MQPRVFLDSSALFAGIASPASGSGAILSLCEAGACMVVLSEQVLEETKRNLKEKFPESLPRYERVLEALSPEIVPYPPDDKVKVCEGIIRHRADAPILAAAIEAKVDYLITLDRKHFVDDIAVAERSGLRIGLPGQFLEWFRARLLKEALRRKRP